MRADAAGVLRAAPQPARRRPAERRAALGARRGPRAAARRHRGRAVPRALRGRAAAAGARAEPGAREAPREPEGLPPGLAQGQGPGTAAELDLPAGRAAGLRGPEALLRDQHRADAAAAVPAPGLVCGGPARQQPKRHDAPRAPVVLLRALPLPLPVLPPMREGALEFITKCNELKCSFDAGQARALQPSGLAGGGHYEPHGHRGGQAARHARLHHTQRLQAVPVAARDQGPAPLRDRVQCLGEPRVPVRSRQQGHRERGEAQGAREGGGAARPPGHAQERLGAGAPRADAALRRRRVPAVHGVAPEEEEARERSRAVAHAALHHAHRGGLRGARGPRPLPPPRARGEAVGAGGAHAQGVPGRRAREAGARAVRDAGRARRAPRGLGQAQGFPLLRRIAPGAAGPLLLRRAGGAEAAAGPGRRLREAGRRVRQVRTPRLPGGAPPEAREPGRHLGPGESRRAVPLLPPRGDGHGRAVGDAPLPRVLLPVLPAHREPVHARRSHAAGLGARRRRRGPLRRERRGAPVSRHQGLPAQRHLHDREAPRLRAGGRGARVQPAGAQPARRLLLGRGGRRERDALPGAEFVPPRGGAVHAGSGHREARGHRVRARGLEARSGPALPRGLPDPAGGRRAARGGPVAPEGRLQRHVPGSGIAPSRSRSRRAAAAASTTSAAST